MTAVNMKWAKAYHLCKIVAADIESARVSPLCCVAYAYDAVKRENTELLNAIWIVESHIGHKGIHPIDRGGGVIYRYYLSKDTPARLVIRLKERDLIHKGKGSLVGYGNYIAYAS